VCPGIAMARRHEVVPSDVHADVIFNDIVYSVPTSLMAKGKLPLYTVTKWEET
jgi:hypothetical protein